MPFLEREGARIAYEQHGAGHPVVLLHGFTSSFVRNWVETGWVEHLVANGFRVVGLDVRSHGASTRCYSPSEVETDVLAEDVTAVLDALGIDHAHLIGFSMGAGIALRLALDRPERVTAVVVTGIGDKAIRGRHDPVEVRQVAEALRAPSATAVATEVGRQFRARAEVAGNDPAALAAFAERGGWPGDLVGASRSRVPVLVIAAARDQYMAETDELVSALGAQRLVRPDADHIGVLRDPQAVEAAVRFLRAGANGP